MLAKFAFRNTHHSDRRDSLGESQTLRHASSHTIVWYIADHQTLETEMCLFFPGKQGLPRIHFTEENTRTLARLFVDRTGCDFGGQVRYKQFMEAVGA